MENHSSPKLLRLGGRELRCIEKMPLGVIFDLAEAMESGSEMKQIAAMSRALKTIVVKEELPALDQVLHDVANPVAFAELNTALGTLMVEYSGRPLGRSSLSPRGVASTGGSSKVVSLSRATAAPAASSSKDGQSAAS